MAFVEDVTTLPRSLDVQVSLSKAATARRTNLSLLCVAAENLGFLPNANRVRFYSTLKAVGTDFAEGTEAYKAALAFFSQSPRATKMAIGEVFLTAQPAMLVSAPLAAADIAALAAIAAGSMDVVYNNGAVATQNFAAMDFTGVTTIEEIAAIIDAKTGADLSCAVKTLPGGEKVLVIQTAGTGDGKTITYAIAAAAGTNVSAILNFSEGSGAQVINGYTPTGIGGELQNIKNAANASGQFIYGWCLGATLRTVEIQEAAAAWALANVAMMPLVTNDITAYNAAFTDDLGSVLKATGNKRAVPIFHDDVDAYPDVSILAYMLGVNYLLPDSTVTAKFKDLPGVTTVVLTETQWATLQSKGYNTFTLMDTGIRTFRDGTTEDTTYFMDSVINFDNFVEDLTVNIYNVFLRNGKVHGRAGQLMLIDACNDTGNQYVYNGTFEDRQVVDLKAKSGTATIPAFVVNATSLALASDDMRAARICPPIEMVCQEAYAFQSVAVNVEVVS